MEQMNFHKNKLYSLIGGGIGLIALILPWVSVNLMGMSRSAGNGFHGWGILSLLGVVAVAAACLLGNKMEDFDANMKKLVLGGFGAIGLGALIFFIRIKTAGSGGLVMMSDLVSPGIGLWLAFIVGAVGVLYHLGIIKLPQK